MNLYVGTEPGKYKTIINKCILHPSKKCLVVGTMHVADKALTEYNNHKEIYYGLCLDCTNKDIGQLQIETENKIKEQLKKKETQ